MRPAPKNPCIGIYETAFGNECHAPFNSLREIFTDLLHDKRRPTIKQIVSMRWSPTFNDFSVNVYEGSRVEDALERVEAIRARREEAAQEAEDAVWEADATFLRESAHA